MNQSLFRTHGLLAVVCAVVVVWGCESKKNPSADSEVKPEVKPMVKPEIEPERPRYVLVIHGGAGTISPSKMTPEKEAAYRGALDEALTRGEAVLSEGGTSMDAVVATITFLEDSPLFNAGKGAVFTAAGNNELDASIMDGKTRQAGAVAGVTAVKNPILLARAVMDKSVHVMLQGQGADTFAKEQGLELVEPAYFHTDERWQQLEKRRQNDSQKSDGSKKGALTEPAGDHKFGTVGAVALDVHGNLAAATSTGGMTNKRWGRVGDSPIIGAGTYADNRSCAVSGTGHGEYFIRATVARDVCALVEYRGLGVKDAATKVVHETLETMGGKGGVIAVDGRGEVALVFNTTGMYRGQVRAGSERQIAIYGDR